METGDWRIFLTRDRRLPRLEPVWVTGLLGAIFAFAAVAAPEPEDPVADDSTPIYAEPGRKVVKIADIDTENFEIGVAAGLLSVEDFETNPVTIATLSYHVTEDFFAQARFGQSDVGESSFETLSGGAQLLADDDRSLSFYDLSLGVNLLPGEAFSVTLQAPGVYDYYCVPHEHAGMVGRIIVGQPGSAGYGEGDLPEVALRGFPAVTDIMANGVIRSAAGR